MLFNSNVFLFLFLPITYAIYHFARKYVAGSLCFAFLAIASVAFYGISDPNHLWLFIASICVNYIFGRNLVAKRSRSVVVAGLVFNLALLAVFKYANFAVAQADLLGLHLPAPNIVLPVGVSFFTFTQIAFLVDAYKGKVRELDLTRYGLFVSFFPHLIAGPIIHHAEMMPQFENRRRLRLSRWTAVGMLLLVLGLLKKLVLADKVAELSSPIFAAAHSGEPIHFFQAWTATLAYTFQIYFDFSAYSEMAIGLSLMLGIRLPANFNSPYKAVSIIDFWRRWHMTLSRFLRDYLYIPLGGNRNGKFARYRNLMITMLLGGIWHGAGWTFALWGLLHGSYLVINHLWNGSRPADRRKLPFGLGRILTFLAVMMAWVPFRAESMGATKAIFGAMFGLNGLGLPLEVRGLARHLHVDLARFGVTYFAENDRMIYYTNWAWLLLAAAIAFLAPNALQLTRRFNPALDSSELRETWGSRIARIPTWRPGLWSGLAIGAALFVAVKIINSAASTEFLYFQF